MRAVTGLFSGLTGFGIALFLLMMVGLIVYPPYANSYVLTVGTIVLYLALLGQSWNLMLGFAGLLSIGHALFVGIGSYTAAFLFTKLGVPPIIGVAAAVVMAVIAGSFIGYLGFRFSISGVHFALLTIAFAEFTRIMVDHAGFLGGTEGLFLKVTAADRQGVDLVNLRGHPLMFYYLGLGLAFATLLLCRVLLRSKLGYYWQAIRDDQQAAQAVGINVFRYKMYAVMYSSAIAGVGGVFYAFYQNGLFPESTFSIERSIEYTLAPIVGGVGTLFGPIFGAFVLTPLSESITEVVGFFKSVGIIDPHLKLNGLKPLFWGLVVALIVLFQPKGLWPWVARALGIVRRPVTAAKPDEEAESSVDDAAAADEAPAGATRSESGA
jgi:branched-chain amino acid transport system permease protein